MSPLTPRMAEAVEAAHKAAADLVRHPNSRTHIKARTMALVDLVCAVEAAQVGPGPGGTGTPAGAQTVAAACMGYKDRQLINRHVKRAVERGWASYEQVRGHQRLVVNVASKHTSRQTEITDFTEVETIDPTVVMAADDTPPAVTFLPPFSLPDPYAY